MKTQAAILVAINEPLALIDLEIPAPAPGQVLVEIAYSGVCHSQINEVRGRRGIDRFIPHTLGHEGSGVVTAIGDGVTKVTPGDRVVLTWIKGKGMDVPSMKYGSELGIINSGAISTFMRHTVTCESRVVKLPDSMSLAEAALLGCAIPTGAGMVLNTAKVRPGDSVVVYGTGGVGLSAILAATMMGADPIIAVDINDSKLEAARAAGATHTVRADQDEDVVARVRALVGNGADVAIEAAGLKKTMENAFASVRDGGGVCVLAGNVPFGQNIDVNPFDLIKGRRIVGSWGGETQPDRDIPMYAAMHARGRFDLSLFTTTEYPLERINEAIEDLASGRCLRPLISMKVTP